MGRRGAILVCCVLLWGCGDDAAEPGARREQGAATVGGDVLATVDGRPITVDEVRRVVRETELGPRQALLRLEERELLAGEASRAGYADDPEVRRATRQAMVQALLEREVEERVTAESITEEAIRARFETRAEQAERAGITLDDARGDIREQLLIEARRERYDQLVRELEERWTVERREEAIGAALEADLPEGS